MYVFSLNLIDNESKLLIAYFVNPHIQVTITL